MKKLNLGCGRQYLKGYINLDYNSNYKVDVNWDLSTIPYPFKNGEFDEIYCSHILEHFGDNFFDVLKELCRLLKVGGVLHIRVPHFSNGLAFNEMTHKRFFGWDSFNDLTSNNINFNYPLKIIFRRFNEFSVNYSTLNRFTWQNVMPKRIYERFLCWIFPVAEVEIKLKKIK